MRASKPSGLGLGETSNELLGTGPSPGPDPCRETRTSGRRLFVRFPTLEKTERPCVFESLGLRDVLPRRVCSCDREGGGMSVTCEGCETDMQRWGGESRGEVGIPSRCLCTACTGLDLRATQGDPISESQRRFRCWPSRLTSPVFRCVFRCVLVIVVPVLYLNHHVQGDPTCQAAASLSAEVCLLCPRLYRASRSNRSSSKCSLHLGQRGRHLDVTWDACSSKASAHHTDRMKESNAFTLGGLGCLGWKLGAESWTPERIAGCC
ncbi:uncharacterized protein LY79DRAFT_552442 [Colletotrichum navitas]|uniref:Uncharacterized protein n=1 Tax=Colletotrichum navitas TaxID=681940 RepID=A0AAD8V5E1_9PEZI|nr:uncharacterized protein LY79DRAFT_552442 [Colletotrichum navitas]KAK1593313.1 hypothetical protein LY79DRAFT_552442 [Colletotrichum navitas]